MDKQLAALDLVIEWFLPVGVGVSEEEEFKRIDDLAWKIGCRDEFWDIVSRGIFRKNHQGTVGFDRFYLGGQSRVAKRAIGSFMDLPVTVEIPEDYNEYGVPYENSDTRSYRMRLRDAIWF